jgi:GNAT superfamily N-acetyltransferase
MRIYEYDEVDPLEVLHLNLLCRNFALTPERVANMRRLDPRPFSFLGLYAKENGRVAAQVGVFRLPVVSIEGAQEVGGAWAVATHPAFVCGDITSRLLEEVHARMRSAGLRYSTLGTQRGHAAYALYRRLGYEDVVYASSMMIACAALIPQAALTAEAASSAQLALADRLFEQIAAGSLGFARRHLPFFPSLGEQGVFEMQTLWLLWQRNEWQRNEPVGYAIGSQSKAVLRIDNLALRPRIDPVAAVTAVVRALDAPYVWVRVDRPGDTTAFVRAGFHMSRQDWNVLMVKPLAADATIDQFRTLHGVNSGRFLMSYLDVT